MNISGIHYSRVRCRTCGKPFDTPSSLRKHNYTHSTKQHACDKCSKTYAFASQLASHKISHRNYGTHQCIHCKTYCRNQSDLVKHLKVHDGVIHYCPYCDEYNTPDERNLKAHVKSKHDGLKRYVCKYCGYSFKHFNQRWRHLENDKCPRKPRNA